jgi:phosphatidylinositol glycan class K
VRRVEVFERTYIYIYIYIHDTLAQTLKQREVAHKRLYAHESKRERRGRFLEMRKLLKLWGKATVCAFLLFLLLLLLGGFCAAATTTETRTRKTTTTHSNNHAILVDASRFWFNYRHAANTLAIYKTIKRLGIPDENIILMVADDYACNSRNVRAGEVFTDDSGYENNVYTEDIEVDYRGDEVTPANVLRVLLDAHYFSGGGGGDETEAESDNGLLLNLPNSKRLRTDENSNVLFYLTGHGGDEFLKFQDQKEITSMDLQNAFAKMREMKRYNELLFVVDTCQAGTMFKRFNGLRNIIAVASSMKDENSYAHGTRSDIGLAVSDRFTRFLYEYLKSDNAEDITLREVFQRAQSPQVRQYLMSTVQVDWSNYGDGRKLSDVKVGDFFANARSRKSRTSNARTSKISAGEDEEAYAILLPGFATASAFTSR